MFSSNSEILSCFDAKTGNALVEGRRIDGLVGVFASPVAAADCVYLTGRNGATVVIKSSDKFEPVATNQFEDRFDASPALAGTLSTGTTVLILHR